MSLTDDDSSYDAVGEVLPKALAARLREQSQLDFDIEFFQRIISRSPHFVDVLRCQAELLSKQGDFDGALELDRRLAALRPFDFEVLYNLACSLSRSGRTRESLTVLRRAFDHGYGDIEHLIGDPDLEATRRHPDFAVLLRDYALEPPNGLG